MTVAASPLATPDATARLDGLPPETRLGTWGMWLAILTEALLFASLLFAYFYVGRGHAAWPPHPPKRATALILLAILAASSATAESARHRLARGRPAAARALLLVTFALGVAFLLLQASEYRHRLAEVQPWTDAYGSLFYTITGFHGLHVLAGVLMLAWTSSLPRLASAHSPHRPLANVVLYWHFVDVVWLSLVVLLYLLPGGPS